MPIRFEAAGLFLALKAFFTVSFKTFCDGFFGYTAEGEVTAAAAAAAGDAAAGDAAAGDADDDTAAAAASAGAADNGVAPAL